MESGRKNDNDKKKLKEVIKVQGEEQEKQQLEEREKQQLQEQEEQ